MGQLSRDLLFVVSLKAALLLALYLCFFQPSDRPKADAPEAAAAVVGEAAAALRR